MSAVTRWEAVNRQFNAKLHRRSPLVLTTGTRAAMLRLAHALGAYAERRLYKALVVCNSSYPHDPAALPELNGPRIDGVLMWDALTDELTGLFSRENVKPVFERSATEVLKDAQSFFAGANADDILLFYFSGHGKRSSQELILCARDTVSTSLLATGIRSDTLGKMIVESSSRAIILILDCCHSGAFKGEDIARELSGSGRFVLAAVHGTDLARDSETGDRPSPFTHAIVDGLMRADIDSDGDSFIDLDDLYGHVHRQLAKHGPEPKRDYDGAGVIKIAKRRLSDELRVIADPFVQPALSLDSVLLSFAKAERRGPHPNDTRAVDKLVVPIGRVFELGKDFNDALPVDFSGGGGNFVVVGGMWTGKTTTLCTVACSIALAYAPEFVQIYGLHPDVGAFSELASVPQVGGIARYSERDRVSSLVRWLAMVLTRREKLSTELGIRSPRAFREHRSRGDIDTDGLGEIFLVIDSWKDFATGFPDLTQHCLKLAQAGLYVGMHLAVSATRWGDLPAELIPHLGTSIELALNDPNESRIDASRAAAIPLGRPGLGLARGGRYVQICLPGFGMDEVARDEFGALTGLVEKIKGSWPSHNAPGPDQDLAADHLEGNISLFRLLGYKDLAELGSDVKRAAVAARQGLRVPMGIDTDGEVVELDIREAAQGGMGPHGLVIGATGSGKSELLRTLVFGLALRNSPEVLNFVLIDFKGGATFLGLDKLRHVSAAITNLEEDLPLVDRMYEALHGEMVRRQELLRAAGNYASLRDYERDRERGAKLEPLPTLFVVLDEFSELLSAKPDFIDLFVMIGRLGRSLGVHLLLASQRLEEGKLRGLDSHLSYRIGMRTFSAIESRVVLGAPDAYELPSQPGHGYLKYQTADMTRFKAACTSAWPGSDGQDEREPAGDEALLSNVVQRLSGIGPSAHQIWLPPLDVPPTLDELLPGLAATPEFGFTTAGWAWRGRLHAVAGIVDRPFDQRRDPLWVDVSGAAGNVGVVGAPQSGKSTLLRSLIGSLALLHTPDQVQVYLLDFGGGTLGSLAGLPHVGGVATRLAAERVRRTVAEVSGLLEQRERMFGELGIDSIATYRRLRASGEIAGDGFGDVFLVVDGWLTVRQDYEALEPVITTLAARGLGFGIHVVASTNKWSEFRTGIRDLFGTRLELRLGDPYESEINRKLAANVPESAPGRGLTRDGLHFLTALPRIDGRPVVEDLSGGVSGFADTVATAWRGKRAAPVRLLPEVYPAASLPSAAETGTRVPFGIDEDTLSPVFADFSADAHFLIFGDTECGKSNLLRLLTDGITRRYTPDQARMIFIDYRRSLLDAAGSAHTIGYAASSAAAAPLMSDVHEALIKRLPPPDLTPEQLRARSWWSGSDLFLVIDDYDLVATSTNPLLPVVDMLLPQARDIGLHLILARSAGGAGRSMFDPVIQRIREMGSPGLIMSGNRDEGPLLGGVKAQQLQPGRGYLVHRRSGARLVQTALVDPDDAQQPTEPSADPD